MIRRRATALLLVAVLCGPGAAAALASPPRYRGVNANNGLAPDNYAELGRWNADLVRRQLVYPAPAAPNQNYVPNGDVYLAWLDGELRLLEDQLPLCELYGIHVVIDLHSAPGGVDAQDTHHIFTDPTARATFLTAWGRIAARFAGSSVVLGYDLLNEPKFADVMVWRALAGEAVAQINALDANSAHLTFVEPSRGLPLELGHLGRVAGARVAYSFHMYYPETFALQNTDGRLGNVVYPGTIDGRTINKAALKSVLSRVASFQASVGGAPILVGEFSADRCAPTQSGVAYLRDLVDLFEQYGWMWTYHAFRESNHWNAELPQGTPNPCTCDDGLCTARPCTTPRLEYLKTAFAKNAPTNAPVFAGGVSVAAGPDGSPWVVDSLGRVWRSGELGWIPTPRLATEVAVGPDGVAWLLDRTANPDGNHDLYRYDGSAWVRAGGSGVRLAAGPNTTVWLTNAAREIWFRNPSGAWSLLNGLATDVACDPYGNAYVIGAETALGQNQSIWRRQNGTWGPMTGTGVNIAAGADGSVWIVSAAHEIYRFAGGTWTNVGGFATDVAAGADGSVFVTGRDWTGKGYGVWKWTGSTWTPVSTGPGCSG